MADSTGQVDPFALRVNKPPRSSHRMTYALLGGVVMSLLIIATIVTLGNATGRISTPPLAATALPANAISRENKLPGTPDWRITSATYASQGEIAGYASAVSVNLGGSIQLAVSTKVADTSYTVRILRLGYYQGLGARQLLEWDNQKGLAQGWYVDTSFVVNEAATPPQQCLTCIVHPNDALGNPTYMVDANWHYTQRVTIPTTWLSGYYLVLLTTQAGKQSYIPFIVRDDARHAPLLMQANTSTWETANTWGGTNIYGTWNGTSDDVKQRARVVSFNRPYVDGDGAGQIFFAEYNMVRFLENKGYDITYTTNTDIAARPALLSQHAGLLLVGSDIFWDLSERNGVEVAVKNGLNLLAFSAHEAYSKSRFAPDHLGIANREIIDYRVNELHDATDPADPHNTSATVGTGVWRLPPISRPENALFGVMWNYGTNNFFRAPADLQVSAATSWVFQGTNLHDGDHITGIVGAAFDKVTNNHVTPASLSILAKASVPQGRGTPPEADTVIYYPTTHSFVFDSGTERWSFGLDGFASFSPHIFFQVPTDPRLQRWTQNLFAAVTNPSVFATEAANAHP